MYDELTKLENLTVSILRNIDPHNGTIFDYRNALIPVDKATRAINAAHIAMARARRELEQMAREQ